MSISLSSSSDDEKYIDFLRDIDEKIAESGGSRTLPPISRREDSTHRSSSSSKVLHTRLKIPRLFVPVSFYNIGPFWILLDLMSL
jgi:hypothetical protein